MVLYHAVSTYQIFEAALHRMRCHRKEKAVLILPDFITGKHENYYDLVQYGIFDEVYLFPYLQIPHDEFFVRNRLEEIYEQYVPYELRDFRKIYVAGVHFFFSILLIRKGIEFTAFEDASGMAAYGKKIYNELLLSFPSHAKIASAYKLFDFQNKYIREIIVEKRTCKIRKKQTVFSVESEWSKMEEEDVNKLLMFFRLKTGKTDVLKKDLLLTERMSVVGIISESEQIELYQYLVKNYLDEKKLVIKPHPDEKISYGDIFPNAVVFPANFPSELLPEVMKNDLRCVYTFNSTAINFFKKRYRTEKFNLEEIMKEWLDAR